MKRRKHSAQFKSQVALEAIREEMTIAEISKKYMVHPSQVQDWKAEALSKLESLFGKRTPAGDEMDKNVAVLERKVGQLTIENDFLKKSWASYAKRSGLK